MKNLQVKWITTHENFNEKFSKAQLDATMSSNMSRWFNDPKHNSIEVSTKFNFNLGGLRSRFSYFYIFFGCRPSAEARQLAAQTTTSWNFMHFLHPHILPRLIHCCVLMISWTKHKNNFAVSSALSVSGDRAMETFICFSSCQLFSNEFLILVLQF